MARKIVKRKTKMSVWEVIGRVILSILFLAISLVLFEFPNYLPVSEDLKGIIQSIAVIVLYFPIQQFLSLIKSILEPNKVDKDEETKSKPKETKEPKKRSLAGIFCKMAALVVTTKVVKGLISDD